MCLWEPAFGPWLVTKVMCLRCVVSACSLLYVLVGSVLGCVDVLRDAPECVRFLTYFHDFPGLGSLQDVLGLLEGALLAARGPKGRDAAECVFSYVFLSFSTA